MSSYEFTDTYLVLSGYKKLKTMASMMIVGSIVLAEFEIVETKPEIGINQRTRFYIVVWICFCAETTPSGTHFFEEKEWKITEWSGREVLIL